MSMRYFCFSNRYKEVKELVTRFSKKLLFKIGYRKIKGYSISEIAKDLKITITDVRSGLNELFGKEEG